MFRKPKRREFARLNTHCLLKYKGLSGKEVLSFIRNISAGGALFHCKEELAVGAVIELGISFSGSPQPIKVLAKVLRVKRLKTVGGFYVGVEFVNIGDKDRELINQKILDIYKGQGKDKEEGKKY